MKFWVILALPWLVMSLTWTGTLAEIIEIAETWISEVSVSGTDKGQLINTYFENNCKSKDWVLTNTTIVWNNGTKHLVSNITYNEPGQPIYTIHITINDCTNHTSCSGKPNVWVDEVNCNAKNVPKNYSGVCSASKVFTSQYGLGNNTVSLTTCINPDEMK